MTGSEQQDEDGLRIFTTPEYSTTLKYAIQVADEITRRHSASMQWSSWHTWDYIRRNPSFQCSTIWASIHPFATCVGFSTSIAAELSEACASTRSLSHLAEEVQTMASWELDPDHPEEDEMPRHCVVALLREEACVLMDLVYSPTVMVIPAGGICETIPYVTMSGRFGKRVFSYDGEKLEMVNPKRENARPDPFRAIAPEEALRSISAFNATRMKPGSQIPNNKVIIIRGIVEEPPVKVPGVQLDVGAWMITTCRLQIDFGKRQLTLQIPLEDWLFKERNSRYLWIQNHKLFRKMNDAVANLVVELPAHGKDQEIGDELQILKQIASFLGLPTRETDRVVRSVYEVWGEC